MVVHDGYLYLGGLNYTDQGYATVQRYDLSDTDGNVSGETVWQSDASYTITTVVEHKGYLYINDFDNAKVYKVNLDNFDDHSLYINFRDASGEDIGGIYGIAFDAQDRLYGSLMYESKVFRCDDNTSCSAILDSADNYLPDVPDAAVTGFMTDVKVDPEGYIYVAYSGAYNAISSNFPSTKGIYKYNPDMTLNSIISDSISPWSIWGAMVRWSLEMFI